MSETPTDIQFANHPGGSLEAENQNSDTDENENTGAESQSMISSTFLQELSRFGVTSQDHLSELPRVEAISILDRIYAEVKSCPSDSDEYVKSLRFLQDFSAHISALPTAFKLHNVTINREKIIGRGGEAFLYHGQIHNRSVVAREVMMTPSEWNQPPGRRVTQLVHREAITHSLLTHPNVLPFLGIHQETEDSPPIIILPFLRHGSLRDRLCSGELIDAESFQRILLGISRGVQYLHSRYPPVVHGDLHPGNVLLDDSGDPNLCDFGLSRIRHEVTRTYTMLREGGNLRFMAPEFTSSTDEQFRTTREGDIFSLSMMFLSAWTGKLPFSEFSNPKAAAARLRRLERPSIPNNAVALTPDVKQGFWDLLSKMWSQDPSDRPSIDVVVARLEELFDHSPIAPSTTTAELDLPSSQPLSSYADSESFTALLPEPTNAGITLSTEVPSCPLRGFLRPDEVKNDAQAEYPPIPAKVSDVGIMTIELHILCYLIANFKSLQKVTISSIETYSQRKNLLKQRMAILELARPNKEPIWLRLERKKQAYTSQVDTLGITERTQEMSQISVQLAAQKEILFGHGKTLRENRQLFNVAPTFRQLRRFLRALDGQIPAYLGWPEAGWFFCSFLQQHIGRLNDGYYEEGKAQNLELAPRIRDWVNARLRIPQTPGSDSISRSNPAPMSWPNNSHPSPASVDASPTLSTVSDEVLEELMLPPAWDQPSVFRRLWCW